MGELIIIVFSKGKSNISLGRKGGESSQYLKCLGRYEVKNPEQIQAFEEKYGNIAVRYGKTFVDLWDSIQQDMFSLGIHTENFENTRICTVCNHHIYAYHGESHGDFDKIEF